MHTNILYIYYKWYIYPGIGLTSDSFKFVSHTYLNLTIMKNNELQQIQFLYHSIIFFHVVCL